MCLSCRFVAVVEQTLTTWRKAGRERGRVCPARPPALPIIAVLGREGQLAVQPHAWEWMARRRSCSAHLPQRCACGSFHGVHRVACAGVRTSEGGAATASMQALPTLRARASPPASRSSRRSSRRRPPCATSEAGGSQPCSRHACMHACVHVHPFVYPCFAPGVQRMPTVHMVAPLVMRQTHHVVFVAP